MFNSETYVGNVTNSGIRQVSGSLIKTDPRSVFIRFDKNSTMEHTVFDLNPMIYVQRPHSDDYDLFPVTVLQVMLEHGNGYICEVVLDEQGR